MLNAIHYGSPTDKPSLLIAHGLFGSARNWGVIAKRFSGTRHVTSVDMRNHGESPWSDAHSYPDLADDLAHAISGTSDVLGHSMGGKAAMALALTYPDRVRRLIVADIAPVAYSHTQQPMIDAMRTVDMSKITSRRDADTQLETVVDDPGVRAFLLQSLDVPARRWRLNLDALEAEMPSIIGFPTMSGSFEGPTLFLSGTESDYVTRDHRPDIKSYFPSARFAKIPNAGHWLHADNPRAFEAAIAAFLEA
ncbi:MAG: alpha/beta fold hydrolase [Silicimonas sp.]|nr:alpha/beta fold hydrolase [Silicimonas sp.]